MQRFSKNVSRILALVVVVALAVFVVENLFQVRAQFLGLAFTASLWWIVVGAALLGAFCSFLLLAPGRVAAGWRNRSLVREQTHRELDSLRSQHTARANWDEERTALATENQRLQTLQTQQDESASPPQSNASPLDATS
jgi:cell shape-determining protein MreC